MRNALAGNLSPSLTACNTRPRWQYTRWLISVYLLLAFCPQALAWELVCWCPLGYWPPITILDDLSPDLSAALSIGGHLIIDHRSPLLAIISLTSLPPGPRVTLRLVHVVPCCWRHRLPMTDRINCFSGSFEKDFENSFFLLCGLKPKPFFSNFHKQVSYTCKKSSCKAFLDFQNQFLNSPTLFPVPWLCFQASYSTLSIDCSRVPIG